MSFREIGLCWSVQQPLTMIISARRWQRRKTGGFTQTAFREAMSYSESSRAKNRTGPRCVERRRSLRTTAGPAQRAACGSIAREPDT
jgi:hypothetical protein